MENTGAEPKPNVYISVTGLELQSVFKLVRFYWHAIRSLIQARKTQGHIRTDVFRIGRVHHTITIWNSRKSMTGFLYKGAHKQAIKAFPTIATGKTFGFESVGIPARGDILAHWHDYGKTYMVKN